MQNIDSDLIRGNIDTIILKTMIDGDMYGLDIIREVENKSNGTYELKQPTLYSCLKRLENQELISSYWLDSSIGGKRHYYKLTEKGLETIKHKQEEWSKSKFIIDNLLGDFDSEEYRLVKKDDYEKIIEGKPVIQYITVPAESSTQNEIINSSDNLSQNNSDFNSEVNIQNEESFEEISDNIDDFELNENTEIQQPKKIQTISEYQSIIDEVINSKSIAEQQDNNDLIYFDTEKKQVKSFDNQNNININIVSESQTQPQNNYNSDKNLNQDNLYVETENITTESDFIQQNLFDNFVYPYQNEVDSSILEFTKNISKLNDFDYTDETKRQEELEKQRLLEEAEKQKQIEEEKLKNNENSDTEIITNTVDTSQYHIEKIDENFLSELSVLNQKNEAIFDDNEYKNDSKSSLNTPTTNQTNSEKNANLQKDTENYTKSSALEEKNTFIDYKIEPTESIQNQYGNTDNSYNYETSAESTGFSFQDDEPEAFFELSYTNFTPTNENEEYKKKLQNLTEYSKINANLAQVQQPNIESKDMKLLKKEFEKEGIKLRQYSKQNEKEVEKNHILINKLNLIKSLILLFAYTFILSASYIIMKNTKLNTILNFSVYSFIYAIIPFAVYVVYYLAMFIINPHKKVPAKYSPRIMMFFSIIITIQLLLIIYCSNLQFGFYSFTQAGYNHLLWIIPSIMSIAPIIITIIHTLLFNSKNFNV